MQSGVHWCQCGCLRYMVDDNYVMFRWAFLCHITMCCAYYSWICIHVCTCLLCNKYIRYSIMSIHEYDSQIVTLFSMIFIHHILHATRTYILVKMIFWIHFNFYVIRFFSFSTEIISLIEQGHEVVVSRGYKIRITKKLAQGQFIIFKMTFSIVPIFTGTLIEKKI